MELSERIKSIFTVICLLGTSIVTVATSKKSDNLQPLALPTTYLTASSCAGALPQERIIVADGVITAPTGRNFLHFGLPVEVLRIAQNLIVSGIVNGATRECEYSLYQTQPEKVHLYTCFEHNVQVCQITFEEERAQ